MRVLIAEDEEPIANLIRMNLTRAGYQCTWAPDGEQAADYMMKEPFDLILLDIMLPKVNGYELMEYATQKMLKNNIGCLPVTNASGEVTGIVTQNDVFKCFLNVLGWDEVGSRITVAVKDEIGAIGKLSEIFVENKVNINHIGVYSFEDGIANLVIRCDTIEPDDLQADLERKGYKVLECFVHDK